MKNRKPRKDGRYTVNVSFTASELSLLSWADRHGNFSQYVKKLIEQDMNKTDESKDLVQSLLLNMINEGQLKNIFQTSTPQATEEVAIGKVEEQPPKVDKMKIMNIMKKKE